MQVILYHPRAAEQRYRIPLSVLTVAAPLLDHHQVFIVDGNLDPEPLETLRRLLRAHPEGTVLGVSVMPGPQLSRAIPHSRQLKLEFPRIPIVWGGWFPSLHAESCLKAPYVDYVVRGRAERSFPALLEGFASGTGPRQSPGVSYTTDDGTLWHTPEAPPLHPDELPPLPLHLVSAAQYHQRTWLGSRTTGYHSSFGCPLTCGFCAVAALNNGRWMGQKVPVMMKEIERLLALGADSLEMFDNNFFVNEKRTREFAAAISDHHIHWWGEGTIDGLMRYRDETLTAMRRSGCRMIFFGAESGSDAVLEQMNKGGLKSATTLALARRMKQFDIVPEFSFVLGNPCAPSDDIEASFQLIRALKEANSDCEIILYLYSPEPYQKSELWQEALKRGFSFPESLEDWESSGQRLFNLRRGGETPWVSHHDLRRVHDFETVLNAYAPGISDIALGPLHRKVLKALATPRYVLQRYRAPVGLRLALRAFHHRRVEKEGL